MLQGHRVGAIILMGGTGIRFGSAIPKQFLVLGEKPIYRYSLDTLLDLNVFDEIILVCHSDWQSCVLSEIKASIGLESIRVISGGETRQKSSFAGLCAFSTPPDIVLIHDAVRPFITPKIVADNLMAAIAYGAADTCIPSFDTLVYAPNRKVIASIPKREDFQRGQTPQTFRFDWILEAHQRADSKGISNATDDCTLVAAAGRSIAIVPGDEMNFKITSEFDLILAVAVLENRQTATS